MSAAAELERRAEITFKARSNAESRVRITGESWNYALVMSSTLVLIGSILAIQKSDLFSTFTPAILASASALVLVQSVVVSRTDYSGRATNLRKSFLACKAIASKARLLDGKIDNELNSLAEIEDEYHTAQDISENHSRLDYLRVMAEVPRLRSAEEANAPGKHLRRVIIALHTVTPRGPWLLPAAILAAGLVGLSS